MESITRTKQAEVMRMQIDTPRQDSTSNGRYANEFRGRLSTISRTTGQMAFYVSIESSFSGTNNGTATLNGCGKLNAIRHHEPNDIHKKRLWRNSPRRNVYLFRKICCTIPADQGIFRPPPRAGKFRGAAYDIGRRIERCNTCPFGIQFSIRLRMDDDFQRSIPR